MHITEVSFDAGQPIDGYGPGFFRIGTLQHFGPLAIIPGGPVAWSGMPEGAPFINAAKSFDVLLVGQGADIAPLDPVFRRTFEELNIGVEPMSTPSACRTYNILLAEGRRIAIAATPI